MFLGQPLDHFQINAEELDIQELINIFFFLAIVSTVYVLLDVISHQSKIEKKTVIQRLVLKAA